MFVGSEAGREAVLAGADGTLGVDGEDGIRVVAAPEEAASADLRARTSRAISIQVMSSV
jgi:hypothetical protein